MLTRKGFTLIEVLIVVIILGILATIAVPQFTKIVEKTYGAELGTNVAAIQTGQAIYALENDGSYVAADGATAINASYSITIKEKDWDLETDASGNISAFRKDGPEKDDTVIFDKTSAVTGGTWPYTSQFK